jgi:hypothetical protein
VNAIVASDDVVSLRLDAYVHRWEHRHGGWVGTGWMQPVPIVVSNGTAPKTQFTTPAEIADGYVQVNDAIHHNLVRLPFQGDGAVRVVMELFDGAVLELAGDQVTVTAAGDARFLEELPADLRPEDLDT